MPAKKSDDPLLPVPCRLPASVVARFASQAKEKGVTLSDVLRSHLTVEEAKPLGKPVPRKRTRLAAVSAADPALLRQLASIGNNLNQIAKAVNESNKSAKPVEMVSLLVTLKSIERSLEKLSVA